MHIVSTARKAVPRLSRSNKEQPHLEYVITFQRNNIVAHHFPQTIFHNLVLHQHIVAVAFSKKKIIVLPEVNENLYLNHLL